MEDKFCLKWNDFESNISKSFSKLRGETQLFDVTLVGQDQTKVSAHRLVLSACSDFFKNIFYSNTHSHPMLYLDGVDSKEINLMLDYIYQGEIQIQQEHLERFLDVASKFKLEGLIGSDEDNEDISKTENINQVEVEDFIEEPVSKPAREHVGNKNSTQKPKERALRVLQDPAKMIDASNTDVNQMYQELIVKEGGNYRCTVCEKSMGHKANMERHVETHMTGLSYDCKTCGKTFRSKHSLFYHNSIHK